MTFFNRIFSLFFFLIFFSLKLEGLVVNELSYFGEMQPGSQQQVKLTLHNNSKDVETIDLKLSNYSCNSEGQHFYEEESPYHSRTNISWIRLNTNRVKLLPGETTIVYYWINVPPDSNLKGSYWSVLLIEPTEASSVLNNNQEGYALKVKIRFAHHIVTTIGKGQSKLEIVKKEIKSINNRKFLSIHIANKGDVFLNPTLTLKLYNEQGKLEHTLNTQKERLYPGNSQRYLLDIQNINENKMKGFLLLDSGEDHLFGDIFTYP